MGKRPLLLRDPRRLFAREDELIRDLVRQRRFECALRIAERCGERDAECYYEAVVNAAAGRLEETRAALRILDDLGYDGRDFYGDPDLGPALRSEAFAGLRETFPPPAGGPRRWAPSGRREETPPAGTATPGA